MFRRLDGSSPERVEFELDGVPASAYAGMSVAAALLLLDVRPYRQSALSGAPRAPYCMMGACFDCLVEIDGIGSRRGCQVTLAAGMRVRRLRRNGSGERDNET